MIIGKPRGGKTLYAVRLAMQELAFGRRHIVTNLPLDVARVNEYLQERYPDRVCNAVERIMILDEKQAKQFWTYRPGCRIKFVSKEGFARGETPDYTGVKDSGVMNIIDELQNFFSARMWATNGPDLIFYLSQHGHLSDTFIGITQALSTVDSTFRTDIIQDFTHIRNLCKERRGVFVLPAVFLRRTFLVAPKSGTPADETAFFRLDAKGLASCYSTAAGVGIHAGAADKEERKRGVHWAWALLLIVSLVVGIFGFGPSIIMHMFHFSDIVRHGQSAAVQVVGPERPLRVAPVSSPAVAPAPLTPSLYSRWGKGTNVLSGYSRFGGHGYFLLPTGEVVRDDNRERVWLSGDAGAVVDGQFYRVP